jgi:hypothetical protein
MPRFSVIIVWFIETETLLVVLTLSVVNHSFNTQLGQTKDYKIGICCFSAKHAALRSKSKDWLTQNQNNVSECQPADFCFTIKIQLTN